MLEERVRVGKIAIELIEELKKREGGEPYSPMPWERWTELSGDYYPKRGDRLKLVLSWDKEITDEDVDQVFGFISGAKYLRATNLGLTIEFPPLEEDADDSVSMMEAFFAFIIGIILASKGYKDIHVGCNAYGIDLNKEVVYGSVAIVGIGAVVGSKAAGWW